MSQVIALVDDDRNILTSVSIALQADGFVTRVYSDGLTALKAIGDNAPDIGVFDIKMPGLDGMELLRKVREFSSMPVIFLTSKDDELDEALGLAMGAKLVRPDKLCINVWGDAAIGFTGMDFETAVRERIPILSILLNNFSMAIELPIMQTATAKYRSTDISGNYADMAKAFGGYGERITDPGEIIPAIKRGIKATQDGQPALLEFITQKEISFSKFR